MNLQDDREKSNKKLTSFYDELLEQVNKDIVKREDENKSFDSK